MTDIDPEQDPTFYTWTWDVHRGHGQWNAEYGWSKPRGKVENLKPLFTHSDVMSANRPLVMEVLHNSLEALTSDVGEVDRRLLIADLRRLINKLGE